jgi:hypothetical protein
MARDSSGTHSLPAGNPVVSGTAISSTVQNNTLNDISAEITDSLSRTGKGPMSAPLELTNGTVGTPSLSFDSDTDTGLYRIGANNLGIAANGAKVVDVATTGVGVTGTLSATGVASHADGAVGTPGINFTSDPDSGMYRIGANNLGVAVNGAKVLDVATTGLGITGAVSATTGTFSGNIGLTGSNPSVATGFTSTLTPMNVPKAWALITTDGVGGVTLVSGFNITSVVIAGGPIRATLATGLSSTSGAVVVSGYVSSAASHNMGGNMNTASIVNVMVYSIASHAAADFATLASSVSFVVFGAQ